MSDVIYSTEWSSQQKKAAGKQVSGNPRKAAPVAVEPARNLPNDGVVRVGRETQGRKGGGVGRVYAPEFCQQAEGSGRVGRTPADAGGDRQPFFKREAGACLGAGSGLQGPGGRTHLVSPAVAAATAVAGHLASPSDLVSI